MIRSLIKSACCAARVDLHELQTVAVHVEQRLTPAKALHEKSSFNDVWKESKDSFLSCLRL